MLVDLVDLCMVESIIILNRCRTPVHELLPTYLNLNKGNNGTASYCGPSYWPLHGEPKILIHNNNSIYQPILLTLLVFERLSQPYTVLPPICALVYYSSVKCE